jgi:hypothetical protein
VACEPRLSELVELYEGLGLEVRLEPLREEDRVGRCSACYEGDLERYRVIFTRPAGEDAGGEDDWPGL